MKEAIRPVFLMLSLIPLALTGQIITHPDSVTVYLHETILADVLQNDYEIGYDSIYVDNAPGWQVIGNRYVVVKLGHEHQGMSGRIDTIIYHVKQVNGTATNTGQLYIDLINASYGNLDINNLDARFYAFGTHFQDFQGQSTFYAPKGATTTSLFSKSLWIGALDVNSQLHLAADIYRDSVADFYAGPVSTSYDSIYDRTWNRVWKLSKADISYHQLNCAAPLYTPIPDIAEWPAHGDTLNGQPWNIAPFFDVNNNGVYEPLLGDYPLIRGDMSLFFVFNDHRNVHTSSGGMPLGVEIRGMAYGYDMPSDRVMYNTVFLHYDIINRSTYTYHDATLGLFADFDIGFAFDDYMQCDVGSGGFFGLNGPAVDGSGQPWAYGAKPPAVGLQVLAGPYMAPDNLDNPATDAFGNPLCDISLNGANFGNNIIDDERMGLGGVVALFANHPYWSLPATPVEFYQYMKGVWPDNTPVLYGGNGHATLGAYGPACKFMFPGSSDSCDYGTGTVPPNGPRYWTEITAGNQPHDRKGIGTLGPFSMAPGETHMVDLAFLFARDTVSDRSVDTLASWFKYMRNLYQTYPNLFALSVEETKPVIPESLPLLVYPNPATDRIMVKSDVGSGYAEYRILNASGQLISTGSASERTIIDVSNFRQGLYFITVTSRDGAGSARFIKL